MRRAMGWLLLCTAAALARQDVVRLDLQHQVIDHFTASDAWSFQRIGAWSEASRERVADLLYSTEQGIGLSMARFNVGAGIQRESIADPLRTAETFELAEGVYDWSRQGPEQWFLQAAKARGVERFLAFACSPPGRLTRNGLTNCRGVEGSTNLKPGCEVQYARYLADIVEHFHRHPDPARRITFDWVSPVNEPQWDWDGGQEGMRASNDDLLRIVRALAGELGRRMLPTRIHVVESGYLGDLLELNVKATARYGTPFGAYLDLFTADPSLAEPLGRTIGYHSYWSDGPDRLVPLRRRLREALDQRLGWRVWQTEYCVMEWRRDLTMETALRVARVIHADLTVAGVSGWGWWLAVSPYDYKDGLLYTDWRQPGDPETILVSKTFWTLGNYSRFVRPGMVRVELSPARDDAPLGSAYLARDTRRLVVVYANPGGETAMRLTVRDGERDVTPAAMTPYVTSDRPGDDLRAAPPLTPAEGFALPERSVVTLVGTCAK